MPLYSCSSLIRNLLRFQRPLAPGYDEDYDGKAEVEAISGVFLGCSPLEFRNGGQ